MYNKYVKETLTNWIKDYIYLFKGHAVSYIHKFPPKHYLNYVVENKPPVILIPGIMEKWGFMKSIGDRLSLVGHPVYIVPKLGNNILEIEKSAKIVEKVIESNDLHNVVILAHSKGGLIGKYLLIRCNSHKRIKELIAIATPFSGTKLTKLIPHKSFRELHTESKIVKDLSLNTQVNKNIISVSPVFDNHIKHQFGSYLKDAKNITVNVKGHHAILFNKKVIDQLVRIVDRSVNESEVLL